MSAANNDIKLSLNVMMDKENGKVLFAVADNYFVDILLSFLTLPLGRIVKVLKNHYGEKSITIGSLNSLYNSLENLDSAHFVTEGAKKTLLNPISSFEAEYERLKLDISDSPLAEYFICKKCTNTRFRSVSIYYDKLEKCHSCKGKVRKEVAQKRSEAAAASRGGVFTRNTDSFLISNDLLILPKETGFLKIVTALGITDMDKVETIKVDFGFSEIMSLLKSSFTSPTPLSDLILNQKTQMNSPIVETLPKGDSSMIFILKVMIQKSTGKLLYAQTEKDFVEFLVSFLNIPLGGAEHLLSGKTCFKAIDSLYRSTTDLIDDKCFKTPDIKTRLMKPNLPHGCVSEDHIFPLTQECLPSDYGCHVFSSVTFPKGQGSYLRGPQSYTVKDDLSVEPYCFVSILSNLKEQKILMSDVEELKLKIGLQEALIILKASLTSTSVLSDSLLIHISNKLPERKL